MFKFLKRISLFFFLCSIGLLVNTSAYADDFDADTTHNAQHLSTVTVNGRQLQTVRATLPLQILSNTELISLNANNVADAAKHFAGVTVKDYGGIGGMKTVSVRGLGALHTGVSYDGIMMSDVQSGQIDLSSFLIENISEVSLSNGQPNHLLQPARTFSLSSILYFGTKLPTYDAHHTFSGSLSAKTGSFGLFQPSFSLSKHINKKLYFNFAANGILADGMYKFMSNLNPLGSNWVEKKRINTDVNLLRAEFNGNYQFSEFENLNFKINQLISERGIPGADTYYLTYSTQRQKDNNTLAQFQYQNRNNCYVQYQFSGKYNTSNMRYSERDPKLESYPNRTRIDNYAQNEYYLSSAIQFYTGDNLTFSSSVDWWFNNLFSNSNLGFRKDASPIRSTGLANVAGKYTTDRLTLSANVLYTSTTETTQDGDKAPDRTKFSPTVCFSYKLLTNKEFRVRAFYKNIFRLPTFNDLYYHDFGFAFLKPETTNQFNLGLNYFENDLPFFSDIECSIDAYYNQIKDKISTVWGMPFSTVRNIGRVDIKGCDVSIKGVKNFDKKNSIRVNANYSFQLAQDLTQGTDTYLDIIAYTPIHSSTASITYQYSIYELGYNYLFAGKRYTGDNSDARNKLKPYMDHSIFGRVNFKNTTAMVEVLNLTNQYYEIVKFYPMPGCNFRCSLSYKF